MARPRIMEDFISSGGRFNFITSMILSINLKKIQNGPQSKFQVWWFSRLIRACRIVDFKNAKKKHLMVSLTVKYPFFYTFLY